MPRKSLAALLLCLGGLSMLAAWLLERPMRYQLARRANEASEQIRDIVGGLQQASEDARTGLQQVDGSTRSGLEKSDIALHAAAGREGAADRAVEGAAGLIRWMHPCRTEKWLSAHNPISCSIA
jgi:hypothetical protein